MNRFRLLPMTLACCATLVLAACEDDATRAEGFYQSGLALIAEGDEERALVELRNVFVHDGFHKEARLTYAGLVRDLGRPQEAYGQYLRLIEQYPDTVDARVALAEMAVVRNDWEEAARHGRAAIALAPDRPDTQALDLVLQYRDARVGNDDTVRAEVAAQATALLEDMRATDAPENAALVRLVVENLYSSDTPEAALPVLDAALERDPEAEDLNILKARLLSQIGDVEGTGAQLKRMIAIYPESTEIRQAMLNWYLVQQDTDGAEAFLRDLAGADTGDTEAHVSVIRFLQSSRGEAAARDEIARLIAANEGTQNGRFYRAMRASVDFQTGDPDTAISDIRAAIAESEEGAQRVRLEVILAQMLTGTGADAEAAALVDKILVADSSNVTALRLSAARLIAEDRSGEAIVALRSALNQNPRDADTLTLMAQAHERDGDTDLVGERLALAMEVAGNASPEAMRYARFLISQNRRQVAVTVLEDARRRSPGDAQLLMMLANIHLGDRDWPQVRSAVSELRTLETPVAEQAATELEAALLQAQDRTEDSLALLQRQLAEQTDITASEKTRATVLILQTQMRAGKTAAARTTLDTALAESPENPYFRLMDASLRVSMGEMEAAETAYRDLIAQFPESELPVRLLFGMLGGSGRVAEAEEVLDAAIIRMPEQANLLWIKASRLEQAGDFDGAISIYDRLYAANSNSPVVANNLASLITTHRDDPESLSRAANIVRRLRGTDVPAFQDTYGWIASRRGNLDEAVEYLEPAAAGLPEDPLVQYHLGMTYAAQGRDAEAREVLARALEIAGDSSLPQFATARETLAGLDGGTAAPAPAPATTTD